MKSRLARSGIAAALALATGLLLADMPARTAAGLDPAQALTTQ